MATSARRRVGSRIGGVDEWEHWMSQAVGVCGCLTGGLGILSQAPESLGRRDLGHLGSPVAAVGHGMERKRRRPPGLGGQPDRQFAEVGSGPDPPAWLILGVVTCPAIRVAARETRAVWLMRRRPAGLVPNGLGSS